jgi:hypothetical protein
MREIPRASLANHRLKMIQGKQETKEKDTHSD